MPTYGQSDAVAVELTTALNNWGSFILSISATRRFARKLDISTIANIDEDVTVEVIPGDDMADLTGLDQIYDDTYGCHIVLMQNVADLTSGGLSEAQMALLLQLRSEIIEFLCSRRLDAPDAVHPIVNARIHAVRHGREGIYDLEKLEQNNIFFF